MELQAGGTWVKHLKLSNLGLKGMLSPEIGQLNNMHFLILHRNLFYGIIPREMVDLRELKVLDLGYNNLNGSIPSELINILSLEFIFLKRNKLYGDLPLELNELISLCESQVRHGRTFSNRMPAARLWKNGCSIPSTSCHELGHRRREPTRSCTAVRSGVAANGVVQSVDCRLDAYESVPMSTMSKHRKSSQLDNISGYESCLLCMQFCHYFVKAFSF
ncbi:leucine-rich repeat receptor-like serine/threonine-protein kinase BAM3 isoform X2 [Triticum aestivum]|uniref:leucine-rich repeat receptor-like serine/threonine-protein kinase BAM3 isoform X2 n=1 Tax=Triticum aestivum TaxID=4565 RepID=UPI001D00FA8B|nr:leucine-rich repeat receptor-like serine/threonine-protein kinase BAM3 isoform X2 [Triticum aestivum]